MEKLTQSNCSIARVREHCDAIVRERADLEIARAHARRIRERMVALANVELARAGIAPIVIGARDGNDLAGMIADRIEHEHATIARERKKIEDYDEPQDEDFLI